jgi:para-nitrobenzyl esterase
MRRLLLLLWLPPLLLSGLLGRLAAAAAAAQSPDDDDGAVVVFEGPGLGRVSGRRRQLLPSGQEGVRVIGLPYANQPVPRFAPASVWDVGSSRSSSSHGEWDASPDDDPVLCPQMGADGQVVGSEDCLRLNLFLPPQALASNSTRRRPLLPVYVFVHGGAYILGSPNSLGIDGLNFAVEEGVVVVTLSYRLGALGFLAHPGMEPQVCVWAGLGAVGGWIAIID